MSMSSVPRMLGEIVRHGAIGTASRVAILAAVLLAAGSQARGDGANIEVQSQFLAGDELRVVVETYRRWRPLFSHSSKVADVKAYHVAVDLASPAPLAERTRVVGPLWSVPNTRSAISFEAGPIFTQGDAAAAAATPTWAFDDDGVLVRFARDPARPLLARHALATKVDGASWRPLGDTKPVADPLPPMSEDRVATRSGRHVLIFHDGKARLFDQFTGEERDDPWLTRSFAAARSIKYLNNIGCHLTDDLNYLVVSPEEIWNDGRGHIHETFDYRGETHRRGAVGLAYRRGVEEPTLFKRPLPGADHFHGSDPYNAFSIGGDLYLLTATDHQLTLTAPASGRRYEVEAPPGKDFGVVRFRDARHDPARGEVVLFGSDLEANITVVRWDYAKGRIRWDEVPMRPAFEQKGNQLEPRSALPIR